MPKLVKRLKSAISNFKGRVAKTRSKIALLRELPTSVQLPDDVRERAEKLLESVLAEGRARGSKAAPRGQPMAKRAQAPKTRTAPKGPKVKRGQKHR